MVGAQQFAARIGHRFYLEYEPALNIDVYDSLLDLADRTTAELADLEPRDRIDVQSFIWVVGAYTEESKQPDSRIEGGQSAVNLFRDPGEGGLTRTYLKIV